MIPLMLIVGLVVDISGRMGQGGKCLAGPDHFAERLAIGIFTDEAWVEYVSLITR